MSKNICKGCLTYESSPNTCCSFPTIKKTKYAPKGLTCPCSTCIIKMVCDTICSTRANYLIIGQFIKSLGSNDHKITINSWYAFKNEGDEFFKDVDMEAISWKIRDFVYLRSYV